MNHLVLAVMNTLVACHKHFMLTLQLKESRNESHVVSCSEEQSIIVLFEIDPYNHSQNNL